ncbi:MAG: cobalt transporter CbiM [Rhodospirillales bacterium]|nr:cobalt transporter CbiM [Rhodospirillales bacterium]
MAHIPDGVLSAPVLVGGVAAASMLLAVSLKRLDYEKIPQAALLSAVFFVASLVHIPVGPTSVHPLLGGLIGLVLGWSAVPAILVALTLQALFFGFGGLSTLGVNVVDMAVPALLIAAVLGPLLRRLELPRAIFALGACAGAGAVALTALFVCAALALSGPEYRPALGIVLLSYGPLMVIEGALTGAAVVLLKKVKPEILGVGSPAHA